MSGTPAVSVVIPAYNAAAFIERTLDTVRAQSFADHEIIVVDDGSGDDTKKVVDSWLARHGLRGRCVRQANKRIAGARNTGLREAAAPIVALLDHDDFWLPGKLEKTMRAFAEHPEAGLVGHHIVAVKDGKPLRVFKKGPDPKRAYESLLFDGNAVSPSAAAFKRELALSIGGFREEPQYNTVEDYDFWLRLSRVCRFYFIDEVLAEYTVIPGGASRKIEYHHDNLETLLRDHFAASYGASAGLRDRLRMRRRLSAVYRAAAGALIEAGGPADKQREYVGKMLAAFPFDLKNIGRAAQWMLGVRNPTHA